jgi:hypothetical protein
MCWYIDVITPRCCRCCVNCMRAIRRFISTSVYDAVDCGDVMDTLVLSRLDYCDSVLNGLPSNIQYQSATNCAECCMSPDWYSISGGLNGNTEHVTNSLICLYAPDSSSWEYTVQDGRRLWPIVPTMVYRHPTYTVSLFTMQAERSGLRSVASHRLSDPRAVKTIFNKRSLVSGRRRIRLERNTIWRHFGSFSINIPVAA